jgi:hypothetical protein
MIPAKLRSEAEQCRRLANSPLPHTVAIHFRLWAEAFETEANILEEQTDGLGTDPDPILRPTFGED